MSTAPPPDKTGTPYSSSTSSSGSSGSSQTTNGSVNRPTSPQNQCTQMVSALMPVVMSQAIHGCANPFCTNDYCKTAGRPLFALMLNDHGAVDHSKVFGVISKQGYNTLCPLPLKCLLTRSTQSKFSPQFRMFMPKEMDIENELFSNVRQAVAPHKMPFQSDMINEYYLTGYPFKSWKDLVTFMTAGTSTLREPLILWNALLSMVSQDKLSDKFRMAIDTLITSASRPDDVVLEAVRPIAILLLTDRSEHEWETVFNHLTSIVRIAKPEIRRSLLEVLTALLKTFPEDEQKEQFNALCERWNERLLLTLLAERSMSIGPLGRRPINPVALNLMSGHVCILDMLWEMNVHEHWVEDKVFANMVLNTMDDYDIRRDIQLYTMIWEREAPKRVSMYDPRQKDRGMLPEFRIPFFVDPIDEGPHKCFLMHPYLIDSPLKYLILRSILRRQHQRIVPLDAHLAWVAENVVPLRVSRENIVSEAVSKLDSIDTNLLRTSALKVQFEGEEGIDEGGVSTEFFNIFTEKIMNPDYALFKEINLNSSVSPSESEEPRASPTSKAQKAGSGVYWFNKMIDGNYAISGISAGLNLGPGGVCRITIESIKLYETVGKMFGLSVANGVNVNARFPSIFYKKLLSKQMGGIGHVDPLLVLMRDDAKIPDPLRDTNENEFGHPYTLDDLRSINPTLANSLHSLLTYPNPERIEEDFGMVFAVDEVYMSQHYTIPLKPDGESIPVTGENVHEFVGLYLYHELHASIQMHFDAFKRGFTSVMSAPGLHLLSPHDLKLVMTGQDLTDLKELRKYTVYEGFGEEGDETGGANSPIIQWFWEVVDKMTRKQQKKFLRFVTGSGRAPVGGLEALHFRIIANGNNDKFLPTSHVCFNVLMLPKYSSKEVLEQRLFTAIENSEGFGLR